MGCWNGAKKGSTLGSTLSLNWAKSWELGNVGQSAPLSPRWPKGARDSQGEELPVSLGDCLLLLPLGLSPFHLWSHQVPPPVDGDGWHFLQYFNTSTSQLKKKKDMQRYKCDKLGCNPDQ